MAGGIVPSEQRCNVVRTTLVVLGLLVVACPAQGGLVVTFTRTGTGVDNPQVSFEVQGTDVVTGIRIDTGDPNLVFDYYQEQSRNGSFTVDSLIPDTVNDGAKGSVLGITFTGFDVGDRLIGRIDLDRVSGPNTVDWQAVLFNNGAATNAVLHVDWSTGLTSSLAFHDEPGRSPTTPYVLHASVPAPPQFATPEPSSLALGLIALGAAVVRYRRKMF